MDAVGVELGADLGLGLDVGAGQGFAQAANVFTGRRVRTPPSINLNRIEDEDDDGLAEGQVHGETSALAETGPQSARVGFVPPHPAPPPPNAVSSTKHQAHQSPNAWSSKIAIQ